MGEFKCENPPGICSQADFDHDVAAMMQKIRFFNALIEKHDYSTHLTHRDLKDLKKFLDRVAKDRAYHGMR